MDTPTIKQLQKTLKEANDLHRSRPVPVSFIQVNCNGLRFTYAMQNSCTSVEIALFVIAQLETEIKRLQNQASLFNPDINPQ